MTTGAFIRNVGKLFSKLKLVTDNLLSIQSVMFRSNLELVFPDGEHDLNHVLDTRCDLPTVQDRSECFKHRMHPSRRHFCQLQPTLLCVCVIHVWVTEYSSPLPSSPTYLQESNGDLHTVISGVL